MSLRVRTLCGGVRSADLDAAGCQDLQGFFREVVNLNVDRKKMISFIQFLKRIIGGI